LSQRIAWLSHLPGKGLIRCASTPGHWPSAAQADMYSAIRVRTQPRTRTRTHPRIAHEQLRGELTSELLAVGRTHHRSHFLTTWLWSELLPTCDRLQFEGVKTEYVQGDPGSQVESYERRAGALRHVLHWRTILITLVPHCARLCALATGNAELAMTADRMVARGARGTEAGRRVLYAVLTRRA